LSGIERKSQAGSTTSTRPGRRRRGLKLELLESRQLMCADPLAHHGGDLGFTPSLPVAATSGTIAAALSSAATHPLSTIPQLSSLVSAAATLYLDFNGHFDANWGGYANVTTPPFDQDGDTSTFSDGELQAIREIWSQVSEDFAPFQLNVSTVEPASFADGVSLRVVIGGDGAWSGGTYGGLAFIDNFTNSITNSVYVFPAHLSGGYAKYVAEASSHEAGHGFGLFHQSLYDASGTKTAEYYSGPGDGRAPIMGVSYGATLGRWWNGTSLSSTTYQDDMAVIARSTNGFGYRPDDHGGLAAAATPLTAASGQLTASGIIETAPDVDSFSFDTAGGAAEITVRVPAGINNLDARLELRTSAGALVATAAPTTTFDATVSGNLSAGSYRLFVSGSGGYGDVGQYMVSGRVSGVASESAYLLSLSTNATIKNSDGSSLAAKAADILSLDITSTDYTYSLHLDGSDIGLADSSEDIDAFDVLPDGSIIVSTLGAYSIREKYLSPEVGSGATLKGTGEDLLRFTPTSLGTRTVGTWSLFFDGSTAGLSGSAESIDAVAVLDDGRIVVSTSGNASVPGITADDEDLLAYTPATRKWAMYLDGSDVGLGSGSGDIDAVYVEPASPGGLPGIVVSMRYDFTGPGFVAADEDAFRFSPTKLGGTTAGSFGADLVFDGSKYGLGKLDIDGIHVGAAPGPSAPANVKALVALTSSNSSPVKSAAAVVAGTISPTLGATSSQPAIGTTSGVLAPLPPPERTPASATRRAPNAIDLADARISVSFDRARRAIAATATDAAITALWPHF